MRRALPFALLLLGACAGATPRPAPPSPEHDAVRAAVDRLFDAMRAGDSAAVRSVLHPEARLMTVVDGEGGSAARAQPIDAFVRAVGTERAEVWDERISTPLVQVDGNLATAWMDYSFYVDDRFSHCGVNAMQLHRGAGGWRIVNLMDTRRRDRCGVVAGG